MSKFVYLRWHVFDDEFPSGRIQRWTGLEAVVTEEAVDYPEAQDIGRFRVPLDHHRCVLFFKLIQFN